VGSNIAVGFLVRAGERLISEFQAVTYLLPWAFIRGFIDACTMRLRRTQELISQSRRLILQSAELKDGFDSRKKDMAAFGTRSLRDLEEY